MSALAARARGLASRLATDEALAAFDVARDRVELAGACAAAGLELPVDERLLARTAAELAILVRWADSDELAPLVLDEDRRSLRAIVRGLAANVPARSRLAGTIATPLLPARRLEAAAAATSFAALADQIEHHPLASAIAGDDPLEIELALARTYFTIARDTRGALATYVAQLVDVENVATALLLAERGGELERDACFIDGGSRLDRPTYRSAARDAIARVFAGTPLAAAVYSATPAAVEDAALAWHLATQARLRREAPEGHAAAIYFVLRRRAEARRIRRAAWRIALGVR